MSDRKDGKGNDCEVEEKKDYDSLLKDYDSLLENYESLLKNREELRQEGEKMLLAALNFARQKRRFTSSEESDQRIRDLQRLWSDGVMFSCAALPLILCFLGGYLGLFSISSFFSPPVFFLFFGTVLFCARSWFRNPPNFVCWSLCTILTLLLFFCVFVILPRKVIEKVNPEMLEEFRAHQTEQWGGMLPI